MSVCICILASVILYEIYTFLDPLLLSHRACWGLLYSSTLSRRRHEFLKKKCVLVFSTTFVWNTSIRRIQRDIIITVYWHSCKVSVILVKLLYKKAMLSKHFGKLLKYKISWKTVKWELICSIRTDRKIDWEIDGRTDITKLIIAVRNLANAF
jgi:hypothetical protein